MINTIRATVILCVLSISGVVYGQLPAASTPGADRARFFPLAELREGMTGTARTVFRGTEPEEFRVEIIGVLPGGIGPKQDLIVGRISGPQADRTSVFRGMSGSPVYIDGKLVGAISYAFPFSKEPICGITPIEQIVGIFEQQPITPAKNELARVVSLADLTGNNAPNPLPASAAASVLNSNSGALRAYSGQMFQPIAIPLSFAGFSQRTLDVFAPHLASAGLVPVSAVGGTAPAGPLKKFDEKTLQGGTSVAFQLTRGDLSIAAAGTVTYRDGEKIYAFGHPFLNLGTADLPMAESHVITVIPTLDSSFKLAVADAMVGTMTQDRATGVYGRLGQAPAMIPVELNLRTSRGRKDVIRFEVVRDEFLTPLLLNISVFNTLVAQERALGDTIVEIKGELRLKGLDPVRIERRLAGAQATQFAAMSVAQPVNTLLRSKFDGIEIEGITLDLVSEDGMRTATLERLTVDRDEVKAGETIELRVFARTNTGNMFEQKIPLTIPADTPPGQLTILAGDGISVQQASAVQQFVPRSPRELVSTLNRLKRADMLYVRAARTTGGVVIGASELPNLPPSVLATVNNDRAAGGVRPAVNSVVTEISVPRIEYIISGQQSLTIDVIK